jgi:hypothetical protein
MANVCVRRDVLDATSCAPAGWSERAFSVEIGLVAAAMNRPLVYDPEIVVARSVAPADPVATTADDSRGLGHVLAAHGSLPAVAGFAAIGDRRSPGAVFAPLLLARSGPSRRRFLAALRHKLTGLRDGWPDRSTS